jgi:hypothetical protein
MSVTYVGDLSQGHRRHLAGEQAGHFDDALIGNDQAVFPPLPQLEEEAEKEKDCDQADGGVDETRLRIRRHEVADHSSSDAGADRQRERACEDGEVPSDLEDCAFAGCKELGAFRHLDEVGDEIR